MSVPVVSRIRSPTLLDVGRRGRTHRVARRQESSQIGRLFLHAAAVPRAADATQFILARISTSICGGRASSKWPPGFLLNKSSSFIRLRSPSIRDHPPCFRGPPPPPLDASLHAHASNNSVPPMQNCCSDIPTAAKPGAILP